jgi:hypothetical protein
MESHICKFCSDVFTKSSSMYRHMKHTCKGSKIVDTKPITRDDALRVHKEKKEKMSINCCYHCDNVFSSQSSMYRHMKSSCKVIKKEKDNKQQIYDELKQLREENERINKKLEVMEKHIKSERKTHTVTNTVVNGDVNNGTVVNGNVNITISFGQEDISKIGDTCIRKAIGTGFHSALELTDAIHFNPKYPEYHNVYIPSMKDKYGMVYRDGNWNLIDKQELIDKIYDNKKYYIEDNMDTFYDSITKSQQNALNRWLSIDDDDDNKINSIKERIKLLLYNKRHVPINTKNAKLISK